MSTLPRMRTIQQCVDYFKAQDPDTQIKYSYIRRLVLSGELPYVKAGTKTLLNIDLLIKHLNCEPFNEARQDIKQKPEIKAMIRKVL